MMTRCSFLATLVLMLAVSAPVQAAITLVKPPSLPMIQFGATFHPSLLPALIVEGIVYSVTDLVIYMSNVSSGTSQVNFFSPDVGFPLLKTPTSMYVDRSSQIVILIGQDLVQCFRIYNGFLTPWRTLVPNFLMHYDIAANPGKINPIPPFAFPMWFVGSANSNPSGTTSLLLAFEAYDGDVVVNINVPYPFTNYPAAVLTDDYLFVCQGRSDQFLTTVATHFLAVHYTQSRFVIDIVSREPTPTPLFSTAPSSSSAPGVFLTLGYRHYFFAQYHRLVVYNLTSFATSTIAVYNYSMTAVVDIPLGGGCYLPVADPIVALNQSGMPWLFVFCNSTIYIFDIEANFSSVAIVDVPTNAGDPDINGGMNSGAAPAPRIMYAEFRSDLGFCGGTLFVGTNQGHVGLLDLCETGFAVTMIHNESNAAPRSYEAIDFAFQGVTIAAGVASHLLPLSRTGMLLVFTASYGVTGVIRGFLVENGTLASPAPQCYPVWVVADGIIPIGPAAVDPSTGYVAVTSSSSDVYNIGLADLFRLYDASQLNTVNSSNWTSSIASRDQFGPFFAAVFTDASDSSLLSPMSYMGNLLVQVLEDNRNASVSPTMMYRTIVMSNDSWLVVNSISSSNTPNFELHKVNFTTDASARIGSSALTAFLGLSSSSIACGVFGGANIAQCINASSSTVSSFDLCGSNDNTSSTSVVTVASGDVWIFCNNESGQNSHSGSVFDPVLATVLKSTFLTPIDAINISGNSTSTPSGYPDLAGAVPPTYDATTDVFYSLTVRTEGAPAGEIAYIFKFAPNGTRYWQQSVMYAPFLSTPASGSAVIISNLLLEARSRTLSFVVRVSVETSRNKEVHLYCIDTTDGSLINATLLWPLFLSASEMYLVHSAAIDEFSSSEVSNFQVVSGASLTHTNSAGDFTTVVVGASRSVVIAASATTGEVLYARQVVNASALASSSLLPSSLAVSVSVGVVAVMSLEGLQVLNIFTGYTIWRGFLTAQSAPGVVSSIDILIERGRIVYCDGTQVVGAAAASGRIVFSVGLALADEGAVFVTSGSISRFSLVNAALGSVSVALLSPDGMSLTLVPSSYFVDAPLPSGPATKFNDHVVIGRFQNWFALTKSSTATIEASKTATGNLSGTHTPSRSPTPSRSGLTPTPSPSLSPSLSPNGTMSPSMTEPSSTKVSTETKELEPTYSTNPSRSQTISSPLSRTSTLMNRPTVTVNNSATLTATMSGETSASETAGSSLSKTRTHRLTVTRTETVSETTDFTVTSTYFKSATVAPPPMPTTYANPTSIPSSTTTAPTPQPPTSAPSVTPRPANVTIGNAPSSSSFKAWILGPILGGVAVLGGLAAFLHEGGGGTKTKNRADENPSREAKKLRSARPPAPGTQPAIPRQADDEGNDGPTSDAFDDPFHDPFDDPFADRPDEREMLRLPDPSVGTTHLPTNPLLELEQQRLEAARAPLGSAAGPVLKLDDVSSASSTSTETSDA